MKKINLVFSLFAVAVMAVGVQAASFSIAGAGNIAEGTTSGTLDIVWSGSNGITFADGGVALKISSSTPGVIKFTTATLLNGPPAYWSDVVVNGISDDSVGVLNGFSVGSAGLPATGDAVYARIGYDVIAPGTTGLSLAVQGEDPLWDGAQGDVSSLITLGTASLTVTGGGPVIPEPATLAMVATGMIGLVLRRRNG
jgi:hypothetical protein